MSEAKLDRGSQARLGEKLRTMYDRLPDEPIPDRLWQLVQVLQDLDYSIEALDPAMGTLAQMAALGRC